MLKTGIRSTFVLAMAAVWALSGGAVGQELDWVGVYDIIPDPNMVYDIRPGLQDDFVYDAVVEVTSVDSSAAAARFPAQ